MDPWTVAWDDAAQCWVACRAAEANGWACTVFPTRENPNDDMEERAHDLVAALNRVYRT